MSFFYIYKCAALVNKNDFIWWTMPIEWQRGMRIDSFLKRHWLTVNGMRHKNESESSHSSSIPYQGSIPTDEKDGMIHHKKPWLLLSIPLAVCLSPRLYIQLWSTRITSAQECAPFCTSTFSFCLSKAHEFQVVPPTALAHSFLLKVYIAQSLPVGLFNTGNRSPGI